SADGTTVAFTSPAKFLVNSSSTNQTNLGTNDQLYVYSRTTNAATGLNAGQIILASHAAPAAGATQAQINTAHITAAHFGSAFLFGFTGDTPPTLSANGNNIAYYYGGDNLVTGQTGTSGVLNVFRYTVSTDAALASPGNFLNATGSELVTHVFGSSTTA